MKNRLLASLAACVLLATPIAACSGDSTEPVIAVAGSYTLSSISGVTLPVRLLESAEGVLFIDAGSLVLGADGTFTLSETDRLVAEKSSTTTQLQSTGTYTSKGSEITLHYTAPVRTVNGKVATNVVTLSGGGVSFVYRK